MSTKKPDVLVQPPSALTALTLAEMHVLSWELKATCGRCGIRLRVSLPAMIRTHGPDAVWWGPTPRCPGLECEGGVLHYWARSIRGGSWVCLAQPPGEMEKAAWRRRSQSGYRGPR